MKQQERRSEIGAYRRQEYLPHIITIKALSIRDSAVQMGDNSHRAPWLGRRPRTVAATRGPHTLATVTVWTTALSTTTTTRSAPSLSFRICNKLMSPILY